MRYLTIKYLGFCVLILLLSCTKKKVELASVNFLDSRGNQISLSGPPQRIVAIASSAPIIYSAVSLQPQKIVNITEKSQKTIKNSIYAEFFPYFRTVPANAAKNDFVPNVEEILKNDPDLIFQWGHDPKIVEPMERVGLTVATWSCCTEEDRRQYIKMSGSAAQRSDRATDILDQIATANSELKRKLSDKVVMVSMLEIDQIAQDVRIIANNSTDYTIAKVENAGYDRNSSWWNNVNLEQIYIWNPEFILIPAYAEELTPKSFYENSLLADLQAIQNKRVYKIPLFNRSPDAPESYLTLQWVALLSHPEMAEKDFPTMLRQAYKKIYDVEISDEQYSRIMQLEQNKESYGYAEKFQAFTR